MRPFPITLASMSSRRHSLAPWRTGIQDDDDYGKRDGSRRRWAVEVSTGQFAPLDMLQVP